jgi:hypothetical protein
VDRPTARHPEASIVEFSWGRLVVASIPALDDDEWQQSVTAIPDGLQLRFDGPEEPYTPITHGALLDNPFRLINLVRNGANLLLILDPPERWTSERLSMRWARAGVDCELLVTA